MYPGVFPVCSRELLFVACLVACGLGFQEVPPGSVSKRLPGRSGVHHRPTMHQRRRDHQRAICENDNEFIIDPQRNNADEFINEPHVKTSKRSSSIQNATMQTQSSTSHM
ncbi:hypothetical protein T492DRAFT_971094 [Pavlovales sp. CCMP2436]|nr:hypothetical protein T492DRAFT_971094 [Pavlovales sp. CCMP2436]